MAEIDFGPIRFVVEHAKTYPRAVFVEGGYKRWSRAMVKRFGAEGGQRILFACGQTVCRNEVRRIMPWFEAAGVGVRVVFAARAGHTYDGPVAKQIAGAWTWLFDRGDAAAPKALGEPR